MKKIIKKSLAYILSIAAVSASFVMPVNAEKVKEYFLRESFDTEYTWDKTKTGNSPVAIAYPDSAAWRASTSGNTAGISMGVADPTGGKEKMMKVSLPYVEGEGAKSVWIDNEPATFTDTVSGVSVIEQSFYFDSDEAFLADDSSLLMQVKFNVGVQQVTCMRKTGFWNSLTAGTVSYGELPMDEWFTIKLTSDFDNGKWYVDLVKNDGTVVNIRTVTQSASEPIEWVRYSYSDTIPEGKESWYGFGSYDHYKMVEKEEAWRESVDMLLEENFDKEYTWNRTMTGNSPAGVAYPEADSAIWRACTSLKTANLSMGVQDPAGEFEKMMKVTLPYVEGEGAKSLWIDNEPATFTDTTTGVSVIEQKFYFDSNESFLADDSSLLMQVQFNGGAQQVICMRKTGFWNSLTAGKVSYGELPMDEWFTLMLVSDFDNGKWYVNLVKQDGTVINVRTVTQAASKPIEWMRLTYTDTVDSEGEVSWYGLGLYRHYKLKDTEGTAVGFKSIESVGGKAAVGNEIGVKVSFENAAPELSYQWYKCLTNTGYSKDLMSLTPISGATGSTYVPTEADLGNYLYVKVFAKNEAVYPGWPSGTSEIAQYPEVGNAEWALDPNPFVMDFGKYNENTSFIKNGAFYSSDALWRVHGAMGAANGTMTAVTKKNIGNNVKDDALEINVNTAADNNGFWMWEHNGFGGLNDDVISIEQKYFIPEGGAFTEGSADFIKQDNRFGYGSNQEQSAATWDAYCIYNGYITDASKTTNLAPIPYGEWFGIKVVYFVKKSDDAVMYRDIVLVREDGTSEVLVSGAVITNATMIEASKNGGYRRSRTSVNISATTTPNFYFGDFIVTSSEKYVEVPQLILDKDAGTVSGVSVLTDYTSNETTPCMLAVAHYKGDELVGIKLDKDSITSDKALKLAITLTDQTFEKGDIVEVFVWNENTLEPISGKTIKVVE